MSFLYHLSMSSELPSSTLAFSHPRLIPSLLTRMLSGLFSHILLAILMASLTTAPFPPPTTRFTRPQACSSFAEMFRPVKAISTARCFPTIRVKRGRHPATAATPRLTSGSPKTAFCAAMTMSQFVIISNPPPTQIPLTAAMIGFFPLRRDSPPRPGLCMGYSCPALTTECHSKNFDCYIHGSRSEGGIRIQTMKVSSTAECSSRAGDDTD